MVAVRSRLAPAGLLITGILVAVLLLVVVGERRYDGLNHYEPLSTLSLLVYAAASGGVTALTALGSRDRVVQVLTWPWAVFWALIALALYFDLMWALVGPGVEPMTDACLGGMDCIGEALPGAPLTGSGELVGLLCLLSVPFVAVAALMGAFPGRAPETTAPDRAD